MSSEVIREIVLECIGEQQGDRLEPEVLQYIVDILQKDDVQDILEGVPPFLIDSKVAQNEEEAKQMCMAMMKSCGLIEDGEDLSGAPKLLDTPVIMNLQAPEALPFLPRVKNGGNTYEVVNIDQKSVEQLEAEEEARCASLHTFLELTHSEDPVVRKKALRELCPCHVKRDVKEFWDRIVEMTHDPDPAVRYQVLHNLCDGSPKAREDMVIKAIMGIS